jgi:hypothetical protein
MGRPKSFSREEVLEKAIAVFWKHGFANTSVQELERATSVNRSGLYAKSEIYRRCGEPIPLRMRSIPARKSSRSS